VMLVRSLSLPYSFSRSTNHSLIDSHRLFSFRPSFSLSLSLFFFTDWWCPVLTICYIPSFGDESLPPVYLDIGEHKPKWQLVKGSIDNRKKNLFTYESWIT
jgi:hypothetical protein